MTRKWNTTKWNFNHAGNVHYSEVIMSAMASQITGVLIVCLIKRLFSRRSKKASKLHVIGLCQGNSPVTGEFPTQRASNAEDVPIWWRHHGMKIIWWNGPQDIKRQPNLRKVRRPTVPWKGRNESPLIDIHSSIKAIHQSVIDIMDIHNSNMDVYNPVMYIHNTITDIQTCRNSYGYPWLNCGCQ